MMKVEHTQDIYHLPPIVLKACFSIERVKKDFTSLFDFVVANFLGCKNCSEEQNSSLSFSNGDRVER